MTDYTWNGLISTDASVAGNWTPSGIPTTGDKAIFDSTGAQPCNFNIPALDEIEIQSDNINPITFAIDVDLIGLSVSAEGTMVATAPRGMTFSGTPLYKSGSCYIEIGTSSNPFSDAISRGHFTFNLAPSTGDIYFDTGIYPNMKLGGSGGNYTPQYVAPTVADSTDVHFLTLRIGTSGTFGPASATPTDNDKAKTFILDSSTSQFIIDPSSITAFDGGYATWTFQGATAGFLIPTSNLATYQGCDFTFQKMSIVATDAGAGAWAKIDANARLYLTDFTVGVGASVKGAGASAIHLINRPTIKGTWGFFPIADGIYHHKDGEVLGVANGGTGLANVGEYEIPFGTDGNVLTTSSRFTFDNNANELTVDGKLTVSGLIDPTGLELTPVAANPGGVAANTLWLDSTNGNKLTLGSTEVGSGGGGGGGTVSSVDMSVPTGFTISGNPITGTGTLALAFDTGYALPTSAKQTQWDTAYGWGDHSTQGYLTVAPPETDPIFSASPAASITNAGSGDVSQGDTAFGWGDHAAAGYLTSAPPETDPIFTASEAALLAPGDAAKLAGIEAGAQQTYQNNSEQTNLAPGWWTVAYVEGRDSSGSSDQRAFAQFLLRDRYSGRHQTISFNATHHFGQNGSNNINVLSNSAYGSSEPIDGIRIKESLTYSGAVLQVKIATTTSRIQLFTFMNEQYAGWTIPSVPIADSDTAAHDAVIGYGTDGYSNFTTRTELDLNDIAANAGGGMASTGGLWIGGNAVFSGGIDFFDAGTSVSSPIGGLTPILPTLAPPVSPNENALAIQLDAILAGLQQLGLFT